MTSLKINVVNHLRLYCLQLNIGIDEEEILADLDDFLERIEAPDDLAGLHQVIGLISRVSGVAEDLAQFIRQELYLATYIYDALHSKAISLDDPVLKKEFYRKSKRANWCSERPFYTLLLEGATYKSEPTSFALLAAFIKQYFATIDTLNDPDLATETSTRAEDACRSLRLILKPNNNLFARVSYEFITSHEDDPASIAAKLDVFFIKAKSQNVDPIILGYIRCLRHFFHNDWKPSKSYIRGNSDGDRTPKRYQDPNVAPVVGAADDLGVLTPKTRLFPDREGLDEDDLYPSQSFVMTNRNLTEKRKKTDLLATEIAFNSSVKLRSEIDVTSSIRRSHNMGIQDTQLLMPAELHILVHKLLAYGNRAQTRQIAIVAWVMLLLSKTVSEVMNLVVFCDSSPIKQGLYIDKNNDGWWSFHVHQSAKSRLNQSGLRQTIETSFTPCPSFLVELIVTHKCGQLTGSLVDQTEMKQLEAQLVKKLKKLSDRHGAGRFSMRRLTNFVSCYINSTGVIDPIYIDFSYAVNLYTTRVARSYACVDMSSRLHQLHRLWLDVEMGCKLYSGKELPVSLFELKNRQCKENYVGSSFTPSKTSVQQLIQLSVTRLNELTPTYRHRLDEITAYHNAFTAYTVWMLLFGTGYRAAWNPLPTLALFLPSLNLMGISDKDDSDFTHSRIVAVPTVLTAQLNEYRRHLGCLRGLIRILMPGLSNNLDSIVDVDQEVLGYGHSQASQWYRTVRHSRHQHGPFFVFQTQKSGIVAKSLSPSQLVGMYEGEINFPANAGRHWLKSRLLEMNVASELINFQMGHWQAGEVPLGHYSALSHLDAINELIPTLDHLFREVGWQFVKSALS
ncbi:hypothetical protein [Shewanella zhangzhouensis]|uniref:hypothetical protein n=1 Tax=Shewanella zhangzhouensis TaxID=2864213 RepID=UPI001C65FD89|nr:hypothetical protein [Shewanella zhangzhouensis]QYK06997.1 hypothetical protein K0H63_09475 [Shewanella zhangzhouensis]